MNSLKQTELTHHSPFLKIRSTNLQFQSPGHGWQKNEEKEKKNTGNCKVLCVSRKRNKAFAKCYIGLGHELIFGVYLIIEWQL